MKTKADLRRDFRQRLDQLDPASESVRAKTSALNANLRVLLARLAALPTLSIATSSPKPIWAAYQPAGFEADIRPLLHAFSETVRWVFPRVVSLELHFFEPLNSGSFVASSYGLLEPDPQRSHSIRTDEIEGFLVPGLVFDHDCNRLGRGAGFYDRTLARLTNHKVHKVGVAFDQQVSPETLPFEAFDVPLDWVVTEARCLQRTDIRGTVQ